MTPRPLTNDERIRALQAVDANLIWMHHPYRPTCLACDGGRIGSGHQRKDCSICDGIGTLRPKARTSVRNLCAQMLLDQEFHAAWIKAQRTEGATKPTEGSTAWSDPTGNAALSGAALEIRANQIRAGWLAGLEIAYECVRHVSDAVRAELGISLDTRALDARATIIRTHWLLMAPMHALATATATMDAETLAELDHAINLAAECTSNVRTGRPDYTGKPVPSMTQVLEAHRKITTTAPPKPKQPPIVYCASCARTGYDVPIDVDHYNAKTLCRMCGDYAAGEGSWPPADAVRYVHRTGKRLTWKVIQQAKRNESRRVS